MQQKILIVDPNRQSIETLRETLKRQGYEVIAAYSGMEAQQRLLDKVFHLVLADEKIVAEKGQNFHKFLYQKFPGLPALLLYSGSLPHEWEDTAASYGHRWFLRSLGIPRLLEVIRNTCTEKEQESLLEKKREPLPNEILGESAPIRQLKESLKTVAATDATVLLRGETGTGKELAARCLHAQSSRRQNRFVAVNCAALTESLLESELFGHEKGAFTGAHRQKLGKFEYAGSGTLFLDEIGELSPQLQAKMLRVLDEREFERVGGNRTLEVQCRIIAASNIDFSKAMSEGRFREDLYYRLNVVSVCLPALRDRPEDIPLLARHFLRQKSACHQKSVRKISPQAMARLALHPWPGNVRELENIIEQAVILTRTDTVKTLSLPETAAPGSFPPAARRAAKDLTQMTLKSFLREILMESETAYFDALLNHHRGHISRSAATAGIDRKTFYRKIRHCGLDPKDYKKSAKRNNGE